MTNVNDPAFFKPVLLKHLYNNEWFVARNIRDDDVFANLAEISRMWIKVGFTVYEVLL